jgi:hypothetical protein
MTTTLFDRFSVNVGDRRSKWAVAPDGTLLDDSRGVSRLPASVPPRIAPRYDFDAEKIASPDDDPFDGATA